MRFSQVLANLMDERGITAYKMWKETGISQSVIGKWKSGEKGPSGEYLAKIADYFGVTTDFLLGKEQKEKPADDEVSELKKDILKIIDQLSEDDLQKWYEYALLRRDAKRSRENR